MIKNFPKSRVSVVDIYPAIEQGIKKAINFAQNKNISLASMDGRRLLFSFCLQHIQEAYNKAQGPYSKVVYVSKTKMSPKITIFFENYLDKFINKCPFPYCGKYDSSSPDLEIAAQSSLNKHINKKEQFNKLLKKLKLRNIQ